jgi:hypothetical protein
MSDHDHLTPQDAEWHESQQGVVIASVVVFLVIGNVSVALRIFAQLRQWRKIFAEDYMILFALVCPDKPPSMEARTHRDYRFAQMS